MLCGVANRVFLQFTLTIDFLNYFCNFSFDLTCAGGVRKSKKKKKKKKCIQEPLYYYYSFQFSQLIALLISNKGLGGVANRL